MERRQWMGGEVWNRWKHRLSTWKWVGVILLAGLVLLCLPTAGSKGETTVQETAEPSGQEETECLERKLEDVLGEIRGVGEVRVVLTLRSEARQVYATETSSDRDGEQASTEEKIVRVSTGAGQETALKVTEQSPTYQGALVVCDGGENSTVRLRVTESIAALTGLDRSEISVCGRK